MNGKKLNYINTFAMESEKHKKVPKDFMKQFHILKKCKNKSDCLVHEILFILRHLKPSLNVQSIFLMTTAS